MTFYCIPIDSLARNLCPNAAVGASVTDRQFGFGKDQG